MLVTLSFVCCSEKKSNNPENLANSEEISENGVKNEFGDGRLIIGGWYPSTYDCGDYYRITYFFYSDGECETTAFKATNRSSGYWTFNPENKILSSSMKLVSAWTLNMLTPYAIQAVSMGSKSTSYTLTRSAELSIGGEYKIQYVDNNPKLIIGKWQTKDKGSTFEFTAQKYKYTRGDIVKQGTYEIKYLKNRERYTYVYNEDVVIIFDGTAKYNLYALCGGYIWIAPLEGDDSTIEFAEEYYYVLD